MKPDKGYLHSELTKQIIGACYEVQNQLGHGFLKAVYQEALKYELSDRNIPFEKEKKLDVFFKERKLSKYYIADFICYDHIILEIKAVESLTDDHIAQVLNYLKATGIKLGLLINFGTARVQIKRVIL
ncbi:GxxExxY protein [Saccharicrinis sp. 156]|uniref:GxxExxY protein n=1 Tax=Saccharicrinis sp. 156 TaxID=3417574 RepID=UPI003D34EC11